MNPLWSATLNSLWIALWASLLTAIVSIPLAFALGRWKFAGRSVIEAVLCLPLVLPPTVVGYYLIRIFGRRGWLGRPLDESFDYSLMFHWHGAVLAAAAVAFPIMYLSARGAFASVRRQWEDEAQLMGANRLQMFWHVSLPLARKGLAVGLLLTFARAMGEFGATVMVLGDNPNYQTLPILIYNATVGSTDDLTAATAAWMMTALALLVLLIYNRSSASGQE